MDVLSPQELETLSQAIGEAERESAGELRLMIVGRSLEPSHIEPVLWLVITSLGLIALWTARMRPEVELYGDWAVPALLLLSALVALPLSRVSRVRRWFVTTADRRRAVWSRAELEFYREGLTATKGATGILLFLSLFERQAVVLADRAIAERLPKSTWDDVIARIVSGAQTGELAKELEAAIRLCGNHLRAEFPARGEKVNELPNAVIVKD